MLQSYRAIKTRTPYNTHQEELLTAQMTGFLRFPLSNFRYFSLSFQRSFHLSLTVLVRYRSLANI